jgi:FkbM family methyltransferase
MKKNIFSIAKLGFFGIIFLFFSVNALSVETQKSYSMLDSKGVPLDHLLLKIFEQKTKGTFIEVGAFDGVMYSNTKLLEETYGWTGLLIEPSNILFPRLCANRPYSKCFNCALGSFEENNTYALGNFDGSPMSSFTARTDKAAKQRVLIRSLQSILDECNVTHIDFFSLDTEGYELNILKGIDFTKTTFDYLFIEIYRHQYNEIVSFLSGNGYDLVCCLSNYNKISNPGWDGTHNDYLFKRRK